MGSRPPLRCQVFGPMLKRQVRLITYAKNLGDLTGLIFQSESLMSPGHRFRLALWEKRILSFLVPELTHLCLDGIIPDRYHVCLRQPRGLGLERDTWRGTPHNAPLIRLPLFSQVADGLRQNGLSVSSGLFECFGTRVTWSGNDG